MVFTDTPSSCSVSAYVLREAMKLGVLNSSFLCNRLQLAQEVFRQVSRFRLEIRASRSVHGASFGLKGPCRSRPRQIVTFQSGDGQARS